MVKWTFQSITAIVTKFGSILTFVSAPRSRDALTSKMNYTETCKSHKKCSFDALDFHNAPIKNKIKTKTVRFYPSSKRW